MDMKTLLLTTLSFACALVRADDVRRRGELRWKNLPTMLIVK